VKDPAGLTACPFVDCEPSEGWPAKRGFDGAGALAGLVPLLSPLGVPLETASWQLGGSR
jgi:hypothetical protein